MAFASDMIPHHAQALVMVDLTLGRDLEPEVAELTEQIRAEQTPQIEQMADLLEDWGEPVPETSRDHANAHGEGRVEQDQDMPGMMSPEDMSALEETSGARFEDMWLEMMIEHHEGAVTMAAGTARRRPERRGDLADREDRGRPGARDRDDGAAPPELTRPVEEYPGPVYRWPHTPLG